MFIQNLNTKQQKVFLALANDLIKADGILEQKELDLLAVLKAQMENGIEADGYELAALATIFDSRKAKYSVMLELIGLGHADEDFDPAEQKFVLDVAEVLGFNQQDVDEVEFWVTRQMSLVAEASMMMEG